jgi:hypothetical protein
MMSIIAKAAGRLGQLGLHEALANREAVKDPRLALAAAAWVKAVVKARRRRPIQDPVRFVLAVLKAPARFGFVFSNGQWFSPTASGRRPRIVRTMEERRAMVIAERAKWTWQWDPEQRAPAAVPQ